MSMLYFVHKERKGDKKMTTCAECLCHDECPLYRGEDTDPCWYEKIRKEKENKENEKV